jgi:hypothetical protein
VNWDSRNPESAKGSGPSKVGGTGVRDRERVGISQVGKLDFSRARESRPRKSRNPDEGSGPFVGAATCHETTHIGDSVTGGWKRKSFDFTSDEALRISGPSI